MASAPEEPPATEIITRILYLAPLVHVYAIPPLTSNKGHTASTWTSHPQNEIFTARIRILESSDPNNTTTTTPSAAQSKPLTHAQKAPSLTVKILLEDPNTAELFAAAPYTHSNTVEATIDSSRFFALRVVGEGGRKAVLGIGFEERSQALDFSIALQDARKVLGLDTSTPSTPSTPVPPRGLGMGSGMGVGSARGSRPMLGRGKVEGGAAREETVPAPVVVKRDWSLKDGQMLTVDLGGKTGSHGPRGGGEERKNEIEPPSGGGLKSATGAGFALLPPPPSAMEVRDEQKKSSEVDEKVEGKSLAELGFDDGEFGEFQ